MAKHCWICKNTEDYFLEQKDAVLTNLQAEITNCNDFEKYSKETTAKNLGFTEEAKKRVKSIKKVYADMTFNAASENRANFLQLEPALEIIFHYVDTYYGSHPAFKTVGEAIENYLQEPIVSRYENDLQTNDRKREQLIAQQKELKNITTFFIEKEMTSEFLDRFLRAPVEQDAQQTTINQIHSSLNRLRSAMNLPAENPGSPVFHFLTTGLSINKKIYLCPFCAALFAEAAAAAFEIKEAQRQAQEASAQA